MQADINEEIAPLVRELWKANIEAVNSCQEHVPGLMWLEFASAGDAATFLDIVAEYDEEPDGLYARITGRWDGCEHSAPPWQFTAHPEDLGLVETFTEDGAEEWHDGDIDFVFSVSVRFPRSDYPTVLARLVRYNEALTEAGRGEGRGRCPAEVGSRPAGLTVTPPATTEDAAPVPG